MRCVALATSLVALALAQVAAGLDLETLLSPAHVPDFLAHTRFRTALHLDRGGENVYAEVLDPRNLAAVVAKALRVGELTQGDSLLLVRRTRAHGEEWTARWRGQVRSASDITQALSRGFSLVVNKFDRLWPRVEAVARAIEGALGCRVNANLYLTPRGGRAFEPHFDWMEGLVMQLRGQKRWTLYPMLLARPWAAQHFKPLPGQLGAPEQHLTLRAGDLLYLPAGLPHEASSEGEREPSLHITFGVEPDPEHSWAGLAHLLLAKRAHAMESDAHLAVFAASLRAAVHLPPARRRSHSAGRGPHVAPTQPQGVPPAAQEVTAAGARLGEALRASFPRAVGREGGATEADLAGHAASLMEQVADACEDEEMRVRLDQITNGTVTGDAPHVGTAHTPDWPLRGVCQAEGEATCEVSAPGCDGAGAALRDAARAVSSHPKWARAAVSEAVARYEAHQRAWRTEARRVLQRVAGFTSRTQPAPSP